MLEGQWLEVFKGIDITVMGAIAVIAFTLERAKAVNDQWAALVPLLLGTAWGIAESFTMDYGHAAIIFKGALLNGGGASMVARVAQSLLAKYWDRDSPTP